MTIMNEVILDKDGNQGCLFALAIAVVAIGGSLLMFGVVLAWVR